MFTVSAMPAGLAGALYVPQVGISNPGEFSPANSIEIVIWIAIGGRGDLADRYAVMDRGEIVVEGSIEDMVESDVRRYLTV